ncbi:N-acetylmuramoyl-L-alanine amidase [Spirosoma sp.]|uniref:N-acetylmuramoyl-L-alanine amidase n=1 Tax=Spirosoma sp. TaxID=1899569 RepID=UPI003B3A6CE5
MTPKGIVLHFTASTFGDRQQIDQWHKENGWSGIGYHYVIMNGVRNQGDPYKAQLDGVLEKGRAANIKGAHCKAAQMNDCTLGISSIGTANKVPNGATAAPSNVTTATYLTKKQLDTLVDTTAKLCIQFGLNPSGTFVHPNTGKTHAVITQHSQHDPINKPLCASLQISTIRQLVAAKVATFGPDAVPMLESVLESNPEAIEATLAEFTTEAGSAEGPEDLETDVKPDYQ